MKTTDAGIEIPEQEDLHRIFAKRHETGDVRALRCYTKEESTMAAKDGYRKISRSTWRKMVDRAEENERIWTIVDAAQAYGLESSKTGRIL